MRDRADQLLKLGTLLARFRESGGHDDREARPNCRTVGECADDGAGRDGEDRKIDRLSDFGYRGVALQSKRLLALRIDRVDRAGVAIVNKTGQGAAPEAAWILRGAKDGD
jgi:hypothetical protein